jgi:1-pyrroline-5-carboxylate dehydrogenase
MQDAGTEVPMPANEPVLSYAPGTPEREALEAEIERMRSGAEEIPLIIGGREVKTGDIGEVVCPHDHGHVLATYHRAGPEHVEMAVQAAMDAWKEWSETDPDQRFAVFLRAAELLSGPRRHSVNAATMLNQSKNAFQAEIDSACELADFWRFNPWFARKIYAQQPPYSPSGTWNRMEYRPLEGFVLAVTPFNFVSIGGNLPTAPAMMGNVAIWKPATSVVFSNYQVMKVLMEAGLPAGVINFLPGSGSKIGDPLVDSPHLAGIHFTGSTATLEHMWRRVSDNLRRYRGFPRIVGETGGKDFVMVHPSADVDQVSTALIRGAWEYQGQKCSAVSRAYIPASLWDGIRERVLAAAEEMEPGPAEDVSNFFNAVIDRAAFESIGEYIDLAEQSDDCEVVTGGGRDDSRGYFIEPTVVRTTDPRHTLMEEEIFGPVLTVYVYEDADWDRTLHLCADTSPYGLTGAVFARDRQAVVLAERVLRHSAGNFYINDKPTGAVVGQQPFGGARASGTNDKAGSAFNLMRWVSPRAVKENFNPPRDYGYPFMGKD